MGKEGGDTYVNQLAAPSKYGFSRLSVGEDSEVAPVGGA